MNAIKKYKYLKVAIPTDYYINIIMTSRSTQRNLWSF